MERRTKYQYTYFVHPFIVEEKKYEQYIARLMKDKHCHLKVFTKEKDLGVYTFFMPKVRKYLFWSISYNQEQMRTFQELGRTLQIRMLTQKPCVMFDYDLGTFPQGKVGEKNGIFFDIPKIEIICFQTGICFLLIKTILNDKTMLSDVINFNYKFRDINSDYDKLQEYENIKIQTERFQHMKDLQQIIQEITGKNDFMEKLNLQNERFLTYTYVCLEQEFWNEKKLFTELENDFAKLKNVLPNKAQINLIEQGKQELTLSTLQYVKIGVTKQAIALLTSSVNTENYTKIPHRYEQEYLYAYILALYKQVFLEKIKYDFQKRNFTKTEKNFIQFTESIWNEEVTCEVDGSEFYKQVEQTLELENLYQEVKNRYQIANKKSNTRRIQDISYILLAIFLVIIIRMLLW